MPRFDNDEVRTRHPGAELWNLRRSIYDLYFNEPRSISLTCDFYERVKRIMTNKNQRYNFIEWHCLL